MSGTNNRLPATIRICRLWQRTSQKGAVYWTGRIGDAKVLIMGRRDNDNDTDSSHTHELLMAPAAPRERSDNPE